MLKKFKWLGLIAGGILLFILLVLALSPSLRNSILYRWDGLRTQIKYLVDPPQKAVFIPENQQSQVDLMVQQTMMALTPTATSTQQPTIALTNQPTSTPTITPTPLPAQVKLDGINFQSQRYMWNYCAPANLAMALSFWGWKGDRLTTGPWLKPYSEDKNVMPYEMKDYVDSQTDLKAVIRFGGDLDMIKSFISAGYPVVVEKGEVLHGEYGPGSTGWMGHYMVFNGYDDAGQFLVAQDSLAGPNQEYPYETLQTDWRAFNYVYMVIYPPDKEADVMRILGPQADEKANYEYAALKASNEVMGLSGREKFFALYNRGTNLVELQDYGGAAQIYDEAFLYYESDIPEADRPYRALWYQTGPYKAYYYTGRYWNVINLATVTLDTMTKATAEESFYWRAMAELALGDTAGAYKDVQQALKFHEGFEPAIQLLTEMGY
jgi:hypothetical protein